MTVIAPKCARDAPRYSGDTAEIRSRLLRDRAVQVLEATTVAAVAACLLDLDDYVAWEVFLHTYLLTYMLTYLRTYSL